MESDPTSDLSFDDVFEMASSPPQNSGRRPSDDLDIDMTISSTLPISQTKPRGTASSSRNLFADPELRSHRGRGTARRSETPAFEEEAGSSGFYAIDAMELKRQSRRPHHLEERLASRKSSQNFPSDGTVTPPRSRSIDNLASVESPPASPDLGETRRQRVIEARRAKLQQRLNHVQEVNASQRLKYESSVHSIRSNLTLRFEEAERNRNEIMSSRAERASAATSRAKEVSRIAHERAQEESDKRRKQVEEKLQSSESRRNKLMANRTTKSGSRSGRPASSFQVAGRRGSRSSIHSLHSSSGRQVSSKPALAPPEAATLIQSWYRYHAVHALLRELLARPLTRRLLSQRAITKMSFKEVVQGMQDAKVIKAVGRLLQKCLAGGVIHNPEGMSPVDKSATNKRRTRDYKNPARVFLSAWMMVGHPSELLQEEGDEETALLASANNVTAAFQRLASHRTFSSKFSSDLSLFLTSYDAFYSRFDAWKRRDTERVIDHLVAHWMDLERLWLAVRDQPHADDMWSEKIDRQQRDIQEKLRKLAGQAGLERLAEARRKANSSGVAGRDADEDVVMTDSRSPSPVVSSPRSVASSPRIPSIPIGSPHRASVADDLSSSPKKFPSSMERWAQQRKNDSVTQSRKGSPTPGGSGPPSRDSSVAPPIGLPIMAQSDQRLATNPLHNATVGYRAASPTAGDAQVTEDFSTLLKGFGQKGMSNEALAHEVVLNPGRYQILPINLMISY
ncbi:hypothetical protein HDU93_001530 [Gonapodya sp. JEL0774]|nr:hypothetical protein HDU93_001530 [Gonapodya sp. JEL0774]